MHKQNVLSILAAVVCGFSVVSAQGGNGCVLPKYPEHGHYTVYNRPEASPGQSYDMVILQLTCDPGYRATGTLMTFCSNNTWSQPLPQCTRFCRLVPHGSVTYYCKVTGDHQDGEQWWHQLSGTRLCEEYEPHGTVVVPECRRPIYHYNGVLDNMRCIEGSWDHVAICQPECGTPTPRIERLIINGSRTERGELPWHAGIYDKGYTPYMQICGGSLVSTTVVISAAHCFWEDGVGLQSHTKYAVALGKIYRPWDNRRDTGAHKSDVSDIRVPVRFMGEEGHFQDDIALVIMTTPVVYVTYIRPVCLNFDIDFDNRQLQESNLGKVAGWGLTEEDGSHGSPVLRTAQLPYVAVKRCIADLPISFRSHITSDKICAGTMNGTTNLCKGDSGGGLVFPDMELGVQRYYLRGVASTAPVTDHSCSLYTYASFTHVWKHAPFIQDNGLGADGRRSNSLVALGQSGPSGQTNQETKINQDTEFDKQPTDCGTTTAKDSSMTKNGTLLEHGELPWHAGIYSKHYHFTPYLQICGGSLVSTTVIISAAQCFWSEDEGKLHPASNYAVALGKTFRDWNNSNDIDAHKSDVRDIKIPPSYLHEQGHYQEDIALVFMTTPVVYVAFIKPVCLDFSEELDRMRMQPPAKGKSTGWGLSSEDGEPSQQLKSMELTFVDVETCMANSPAEIRPYITHNKICISPAKGVVCKGDAGGGVAFPTVDSQGTRRFYLQGIISVATPSVHECNVEADVLLTHVLKQENFIKKHLNNNSE